TRFASQDGDPMAIPPGGRGDDAMSKPLDSIRVIDFGQYLAGPLVALLLADNGADVIRVDPSGGPRWQHATNAMLQRGKVAYPLAAANVSRPLVSRLKSLHQPCVRARIRFSALRSRLLACL